MTNKDIKSVQIIAEIDDGTHIITLSDNRMLIDVIVSLCQFQRIDETQISEIPLTEIIVKGGENENSVFDCGSHFCEWFIYRSIT